jgi:bifunctional DNA primase/polymerase-like protein
MYDTTPDLKLQAVGDVALYCAETLGWAVAPAEYPIFEFDFDPDWPEISCSCEKGANCPTPGKHTMYSWRTIPRPSGKLVRKWFELEPNANLAILGGKRSGGLVIGDADPRHGGCLEDFWARG